MNIFLLLFGYSVVVKTIPFFHKIDTISIVVIAFAVAGSAVAIVA